jgi:hypothetical protein
MQESLGPNTIKRDSKNKYQSSSVAHVTQLETELTSIIGRQIMTKIHTYPIHNVGTIDDFLRVKVKYLDNVDNSKQIHKIPTVLSVPQETRKNL